MGRIIGYQYDNDIKDDDAWIGTEETSRRTKQYTAKAVADYLNISGGISIIGQMTYKYGTTPLSGVGTFAVFGGGPDIVAFSAVTKLTLSNQDIGGQRVVEFLNLLVGSDILIAEQEAISTFGYYSIDSYAVNATDPNYYDLDVTFKSGNGSMRSDRIYEAQNFVLANDATQSPWNTVPDGISYTAANVGVGTETPGEKLEVSGNILGDGILIKNTEGYKAQLNSSELSEDRGFGFPDSSGTLALTSDITSSPWDTVAGGINYANGNVGIGTTSPGAKLEVSGNLRISDDGTNLMTISNESAEDYFSIFQSSNNKATLTFGDVDEQYGTLFTVDVENEEISLFTNGTTTIGDNGFGNSTKFVVDDVSSKFTFINGNVGIGTTSPSYKLHISGAVKGNDIFANLFSVGNEGKVISTSTLGLQLQATSGSKPITFFTNVGGNTERMRITSGGNVGIGTTSPSEKLDVEGNIRVGQNNGFYINNQNVGIKRDSNDLVLGGFGNVIIKSSNATVINQAERMRITSAGNVGIGTTSPSAKLHVSSDSGGALSKVAHFVGGGSTDDKSQISVGGNTSSALVSFGFRNTGSGFGYIANASDTEIIAIDGGNERVGIGTTSPGAKLEVSSTDNVAAIINSTNTFTFLDLENDGANRVQIGNASDGNFIIRTADTERVRVNSVGNVGIGTTSPSTKLHVQGAASGYLFRVQGTSTLNVYDPGVLAEIGVGSGSGDKLKLFSNDSLNNGITIDISGNVGIGTTSPAERLHVVGYAKATTGFKIGNYTIIGESGNETYINNSAYYPIFFRTNNSTRMTISNAGNVGIGTTGPTSKLDVAGGDIELDDSGAGIIMRSPDGTKYRITVANGGTLTVTAV